MPFLDRLSRLRLFKRASDLERDLRSTIDVGMPAVLTEAKRAIEARVAPIETALGEHAVFHHSSAPCIRCKGVYLMSGLQLFHAPTRVNGGAPKDDRWFPVCMWCVSAAKQRGMVGKEVTEDERAAVRAAAEARAKEAEA